MAAGETGARPYELGGATGCDYCAYRSVCGFDVRLEGCEYHSMEKYSRDEALAHMREELQNGENAAAESGGKQRGRENALTESGGELRNGESAAEHGGAFNEPQKGEA